MKNGTDNKDVINKQQMESYVASNLNIPSQLQGAGPDTIRENKVPIYNAVGAIYCDRIKMRHSTRSFQILPRAQTGDNMLYISDLGGTNQTIAFQRPITEYLRGTIITSNELAFVICSSSYFFIPFDHRMKEVHFSMQIEIYNLILE